MAKVGGAVVHHNTDQLVLVVLLGVQLVLTRDLGLGGIPVTTVAANVLVTANVTGPIGVGSGVAPGASAGVTLGSLSPCQALRGVWLHVKPAWELEPRVELDIHHGVKVEHEARALYQQRLRQ